MFKVSTGSSKVVDFSANRKRVCDFLLVINSNLGHILHRFEARRGLKADVRTIARWTSAPTDMCLSDKCPQDMCPGLVTIPDNRFPLENSRKNSQVLNVFMRMRMRLPVIGQQQSCTVSKHAVA